MNKKDNEHRDLMRSMPSFSDLFSEVQARINSVFDGFHFNDILPDQYVSVPSVFGPISGSLIKGGGRDYPRINLSEDARAYFIEAAVPGWQMKDIHVAIEDNVLIISGHREHKEERKDGLKVIERTIAERNFEKRYTLPEVDVSNIKAIMKDGILTIRLPKVIPEKSKRVEIPVENDLLGKKRKFENGGWKEIEKK